MVLTDLKGLFIPHHITEVVEGAFGVRNLYIKIKFKWKKKLGPKESESRKEDEIKIKDGLWNIYCEVLNSVLVIVCWLFKLKGNLHKSPRNYFWISVVSYYCLDPWFLTAPSCVDELNVSWTWTSCRLFPYRPTDTGPSSTVFPKMFSSLPQFKIWYLKSSGFLASHEK